MKKIFFLSLLVILTLVGIAPTVQAQSTPQYGEELLTNIPPAATDFTGWTTSSSDSECIPTCDEGWFKTSYTEGTISQTIDLTAKGYTTPVVANTLLLYAAAEYFVGWENLVSGIAKVYVDFLDAEGNILSTNYVLNREGRFGIVDITLVEDMFTIPDNTTQVRYVLQGQDQCNWIGYFGPWFRNMSCKVFDHTKVGKSINVSVAETLGDSLTLSKTSDFRYGDTITVTPTYPQHPVIGLAVNEGRIINGNQVVCMGENIIISAELMSHKSVPYFEGFENGNKQDYKVAGWLVQYEEGNCNWSANNTGTSDNRSPYDGSWNATLFKGNTNWLFQALSLEKGETYALSLYARQTYSTTANATIAAVLGTAFDKEAMSDTLIAETGVNSEYQQLTDTFQVSESKVYALGIRGCLNMKSWALALDNILVSQKVYPASVATPVGVDVFTEDAARAALATLLLTAQDRKGNTKCTITNLAENWVLDLENKKATYTAADSLLPMGYYCTETITVDLVQQYTVTATCNPEQGTIIGAGKYNEGTEVTLTAIANEGYSFLNWSDGTKGATYTFTLTQDTVLTAIFVQYGEELLTNIPPVATDFTDWTTSGSVECKEGWFKTGNSVSTISQTIDLAAKGYTTPVAENTFFIYAAAEYCEYWGGSARGVAKVYVEFLDENGNVLAADYVLNRENYSGYVDITRVSNKFVIPANTTKVRYVLQGRDQKGWAGYYGPWFRNMSCKVFDYTKVGTSINVSVDAALGDSITLSKTSDFLYGDTITVTAKYPEHPILWITSNEGQLLEDNQLICWGTDIVVGAQLKYDHTISFNATHATIISDTTKAGGGDTITLSYTMEEGYYFVEYTTDVEVDWIDANRFIMPDANITIGVKFIAPNALPYFEGFENGNSQDAHIEGWAWQKEGSKDWLANTSNTDFNQKPYKGSWNATLEFNNAAWLFQAFTFEKGKTYCISFYARTSGSATLRVMLGNSNHKDSMQVTLIPDTSISNGNYKKISGAIKVEKDGNYVIGIRGYMNDIRNALSIDNVVVEEAQAHAITLNNSTHATLTADKASAYIGDTVTLSYTLDENCFWLDYTTDINVTWIDANRFIMPDAPVAVGNTAIAAKSLPYFEGFEDGNTQDAVIADWLQQSEYGDYSWVASSTYTDDNRPPYAGSSWKATLYYNNIDWLFQALALEAGENYVLSLYARQDYANYANITAALGTAFNKDSMTTTLIPETGLPNGDYQLLTATFQVAETKPYVLGIRGELFGYDFHYISMDNIMVEQEVYPASVDTLYFDVLTEDAVRTALAALSLTAQDSKGNTKHTFDNLAENWVLDLENKKATYTVADNLLPMGYFFSNTTATISVALQLNTYSLSFATNDAAMGSVSSTHEADTYNYGTEVTLTATPNEHYHFVQWSDGATEATYTFTLTQDTTLTAIFAIDQHTVTVSAGENGTVKMEVNDVETTETVFAYGTEITLTATANTGYSFDKWSDDNTDNPRIITVTENVTLSATFKQDAPTQLSETNAETKVEKVLRNGQVFIIRNGNTYDLTGRKAE